MSQRVGGRRARGILTAAALACLAAPACFAVSMPGASHEGPLPPLSAQEQAVAQALRAHVQALAGDIGERHVGTPEALRQARDYVVEAMRRQGLGPELQPYQVQGIEVANVEARVAGTDAAGEIVVVGAHYDTAPGCPGADDNTSGVAALLEVGRLLAAQPHRRSLALVAFVNEEPPYFHTEAMGSLVYARRAAERRDAIKAMLSLETLGYFDDRAGSQKYPFPFSVFYPDVGDFIGFVGDYGSRALIRRCTASFRQQTAFPAEGAALPRSIPGADWSDHWSFWQIGVPALMVTDTAPFRNPHYHELTDTLDRLDFERAARVTAGLARVVAELLDAPEL